MLVIDGHLRGAGDQQITSLSSSTALTVPAGAHYALIKAESQDVRFRMGGEVPTSSVGILLFAGDYMLFNGELSELRFIEVAASALLNVQYFKK